MEKFVNFRLNLPITPVCPQPAENSIWSFAFDVRLYWISTVPFSGSGIGFGSIFSGSKCPIWAISRTERIKSSRLNNIPGLVRSSRRTISSYKRSLPLMITRLMVACGPSWIRTSKEIESLSTSTSTGSALKKI